MCLFLALTHVILASAGIRRLSGAPRQVVSDAPARRSTESDSDESQSVDASELYRQSMSLAAQGQLLEAAALAERAVTQCERTHGPEHIDLADYLDNLANLKHKLGAFAEAEPLFLRAQEIRVRALGAESLNLAWPSFHLGEYYLDVGAPAKAEPVFARSVELFERVFGPEHFFVAKALDGLAQSYVEQGLYAQALPLFVRANAILEKPGDPDAFIRYSDINNLGQVYFDLGSDEKAEALFLHAIAITEKAFGPEYLQLATPLDNIAQLYSRQGEDAKAEPLYRRALEIRERALGPDDELVAVSLHDLGMHYMNTGAYAKAEPLFERAVAIDEKALGPDHPNLGSDLADWAKLAIKVGDFSKAESRLDRSLVICEQAFGPDHPEIARESQLRSRARAARGHVEDAVADCARADEAREREFDRNLAVGSDRDKRSYLDLSLRELDWTLSLHTQLAPTDPRAREMALDAVLRRKGRALDAMTESVAALQRRALPEDQSLFQKLTDERRQLAAITLTRPPADNIAAYRRRLVAHADRVAQAERAVSQRSAEFRAVTQPVSLESVRKAIPPDAVLIEFVSYSPYGPTSETPGARRYAAYVLRPEGVSGWADLGEAAPIDAAIRQLRQALRSPDGSDVARIGRALDERVMRPVRPLLGTTTQLLVSPDGALNLVPFAALVDERGRYLVERYTISFLTSGRDLLRLQSPAGSSGAPVVFADPDYSASPGQSEHASPPTGTRAADVSHLFFTRLPAAQQEGVVVGRALGAAKIYTRREASESALKRVHGPSVLHVATHGFFFEEAVASQSGSTVPGGATSEPIHVEDPLLRSGLAFAGANSRDDGSGEDGLLTALEAASLDLWGTRLVVLSACDTGVGDVRTGEGVYGLRRALVLAGSESQVMSLWQVDSDATRDLMEGYYAALAVGEGRAEALRSVQLRMLASPRRHPYYWAAFIESGARSPLPR